MDDFLIRWQIRILDRANAAENLWQQEFVKEQDHCPVKRNIHGIKHMTSL